MLTFNIKNTSYLALVLSVLTGTANAADHYTVTDLGTLGDATIASGLNDQGVAVGFAVDILYRYHGFTSDQGIFTPITTMGMNAQAQAMGINSLDQTLVASYMLGEFRTTALLYENGMPMTLGEFMPTAINDIGQVVGSKYVVAPGGYQHEQACRWSMGSVTLLEHLDNGTNSLALGLNDSGWTVGSAIRAGSLSPTATLWIDSTPIDLGTLGGSWSQATAINDANQVVGISKKTTGETHAFRYTLNGSGTVLSRTDLGELAQGYSIAKSINNAGEIVGASDNRAFVWTNGTMIDLNTQIDANSPWKLASATGINESGQIVGVGSLGGDAFRAFLLTPTLGCAPDLTGDGHLNFFDISALLVAFTNMDPLADWNNDGSFNFFDISAYLAEFNLGCP